MGCRDLRLRAQDICVAGRWMLGFEPWEFTFGVWVF